MSSLTVYHEDGSMAGPTITDYDSITRKLAEVGVQFERWRATQALPDDASQEQVLDAYRDSIEALNRSFGFKSVDVVSLRPDHPQKSEFRQKFFAEHTHADFEIRFFVDGQGLFYLHIGDQVLLVTCTRGDLISVPANITHWFDMGEHPDFRCIRFFTTPDGWLGEFTASDIHTRFPDFDSHAAACE
ncbi:MAG: cupin [Thiogranum sp.]|nr:cupin [Thiogranum sp.]